MFSQKLIQPTIWDLINSKIINLLIGTNINI